MHLAAVPERALELTRHSRPDARVIAADHVADACEAAPLQLAEDLRPGLLALGICRPQAQMLPVSALLHSAYRQEQMRDP